ncbi:hypothetical protein [Sporolactobacillus laevolacticus]|uniref:Uncharacterized protein n=1 Tax=Sporolactobacillus laevolacticus DSM 442 TaxID=1395513 RepID=V6IXY4_9BACL|nr:hypothetical protein [Sporolactobacillus laevolacticus]EST12232.1 hypothetical protein P343_08110 [Sporolactobacillus laevolacticus DSM 442]
MLAIRILLIILAGIGVLGSQRKRDSLAFPALTFTAIFVLALTLVGPGEVS